MKSNARRWTPPAATPLITMLWLSACAAEGSDRLRHVGPPVVEYTNADQARAAEEVNALPEGAIRCGLAGEKRLGSCCAGGDNT